ncbi:hypothetical protein [Bordetella flabilis]|uniref:Portal protein n=1 Tax=Bordetella flabilis TaxID=463014 RepID=A0A193GB02_9BORD|nr:hypothetical protein [Bordetella flabilis]ANN76803.1 hypothetical protein BAU07_06460 [Bordetella flabilis]
MPGKSAIPIDDVDALEQFLAEQDASEANAAANNPAPRRDEDGGMSDDELGALIQGELNDAVSFTDMEIGPERAEATKRYRGDAYGDEEDGRSKVVSSDVRDVVLGQLPDLMRIFFGAENVVEYEPSGAVNMQAAMRQTALAEQATAYANYVFERDNDGFEILHSVFKDALIRKVGFAKFWWDDSVEVKTETYTGVDDIGMQVLQDDDEVEDIETLAEYPDETAAQIPLAPDMPMPPPALLRDLRIKRRVARGRVKIEALPPEEFIIDRRARSAHHCALVGHRSMKTVSDLVAMGYDEDEVRTFVTSPELDNNIEYIERQPFSRAVGSFDALNPATQRVLYVEAYVRVDYDGDGIAELRKVCTMGSGYKVVHHEAADHVPFADFQCDPEPHTFFGLSLADVTMDLQRTKTVIWRNSLDSLAQSIHPRMGIVEGQVNVDDVLNNENGAVIRMRAPGMVQPLATPFVGQAAFPMLEYLDDVREMRTGVSRAQLGLDPDSLQSTNKLAVQQSISGSQGKVELQARILANGMRKLFKGILHLVVQNQDRPRTVRIRGQWVTMDPRAWNADLDVKVNIALGTGTVDSKLQALGQIVAKQEQILQTLGLANPIVSLSQYANALRAMTELSGFRDSSRFFSAVPDGYQPPAQQQPPPDPTLMLAQGQIRVAQERLELDKAKAVAQEQREQQKNAMDAMLRLKELELKYAGQERDAALDAAIRLQMAEMDQQGQSHRATLGHIAKAASAVAQPQVSAQQPDFQGM